MTIQRRRRCCLIELCSKIVHYLRHGRSKRVEIRISGGRAVTEQIPVHRSKRTSPVISPQRQLQNERKNIEDYFSECKESPTKPSDEVPLFMKHFSNGYNTVTAQDLTEECQLEIELSEKEIYRRTAEWVERSNKIMYDNILNQNFQKIEDFDVDTARKSLTAKFSSRKTAESVKPGGDFLTHKVNDQRNILRKELEEISFDERSDEIFLISTGDVDLVLKDQYARTIQTQTKDLDEFTLFRMLKSSSSEAFKILLRTAYHNKGKKYTILKNAIILNGLKSHHNGESSQRESGIGDNSKNTKCTQTEAIVFEIYMFEKLKECVTPEFMKIIKKRYIQAPRNLEARLKGNN